ncbi:MAG: aminomethyl-transferring glycine dehydrogenase subunit GcvPA [bacterium]|nr:aminomethyl-transferring glycine dehydrogenase subunit GcvPA [Bacillota bacterium]
MGWHYLPHTDDERAAMLETLGLNTVEDLFIDIPDQVRFDRELELPAPLAEPELYDHMYALAAKNANLNDYATFLGAGVYDHYVPSAVRQILARNEFYTAYTPYQPETSQGILQAMFEYQDMICELTGMDVANASLYDGATAVAEAALVAVNSTRNTEIVVADTVNPAYRTVLSTYVTPQGFTVKELPNADGVLDPGTVVDNLGPETACLIVQTPNFFGILEDITALAKKLADHKAVLIVVADPIGLGLLEPPVQADIVVGDGQSLGNAPSFGGPLLGFLAAKQKLVRRLPGRIVGQTTDKEGNRGFVLTLQTREQHIRREKATSNICSNQALNALAAAVYMTLMGPQGLRQVAELSLKKAHYAADRIAAVPGFSLAFDRPFFKEFVIKANRPISEINQALLGRNIIGGLDLSCYYPELKDHMLLCVTERRTRAEIDTLVSVLEGMS